MYNRPAQVQLVLIDPKARGFAPLQRMTHVLGELVSAQEDVRDCLHWLVGEMERRRAAQIAAPALVVAIDELADLIQTGGSRIEALIARLCAGGRDAGIHLIACAQGCSQGLKRPTLPIRYTRSPDQRSGKTSWRGLGASNWCILQERDTLRSGG